MDQVQGTSDRVRVLIYSFELKLSPGNDHKSLWGSNQNKLNDKRVFIQIDLSFYEYTSILVSLSEYFQ